MTDWSPEQVKAIIFDIDGTLYSFPGNKHIYMACRLWSSLYFLRHLNAARNQLRKELFGDGEHFLKALYQQLATRSGKTLFQAEQWYNQKFWPAFISMVKSRSQSRPGLADLLAKLHDKGIKLVVLSDYDHIDERLEALKIDPQLFDAKLSSQDFGQLKPAVVPFVAALDSVKIGAAQGLVIGDSPKLDQLGAKAAKIAFLGISDDSHPDTGYYNWSQLKGQLERILEVPATTAATDGAQAESVSVSPDPENQNEPAN